MIIAAGNRAEAIRREPAAMNCDAARYQVAGRLGWAPNGFAAIPTAAIDPPHGAASPAVPALFWVRVPTIQFSSRAWLTLLT